MARRKPDPSPPEARPPGRPLRLLEAEPRDRFLQLVKVGLWQNEAARAVRWSPKSVERWIQLGEQSLTEIGTALDAAEDDPTVEIPEPREPFVSFVLDLRQAQSEVDAVLIGSIQQAARQPRLWQAAAWLLEKRHPREFGTRRLEVVGDPDQPVVVSSGQPGLSSAEIAARAAEVLSIMAETTGDPTLSAVRDAATESSR